jgi:hypothetical protein
MNESTKLILQMTFQAAEIMVPLLPAQSSTLITLESFSCDQVREVSEYYGTLIDTPEFGGKGFYFTVIPTNYKNISVRIQSKRFLLG